MQLDVRDVSALFRVPESTIYRWVNEANLPSRQVNGQHRFNRAELFEWLTTHRVEVSPAVFRETAGLSGILEAGGLLSDIRGDDKESVLRAVVQNLSLPADFDREVLLQLFLSRESLASTGIGDGIAIPHPRYPVVIPGERPTVTLCYLPEPIEFAATDGRPVDILFVLTNPTVRSHALVLAQLACALRDGDFRSVVKRKAPFDVVLQEARRWDDLCHQSAHRNGLVPS